MHGTDRNGDNKYTVCTFNLMKLYLDINFKYIQYLN